jgi:branched-chain amino acid transport system ATP-binding protein
MHDEGSDRAPEGTPNAQRVDDVMAIEGSAMARADEVVPADVAPPTALVCQDIEVSYGRVDVLKGLSLEAHHGKILTVLGPNGSGKSTMLKTVAGVVRARRGLVHLYGKDITKHRVQERVRAGITLVPQGRRLFGGLTVEENLRLGAFPHRNDEALVSDLLDRWLSVFPTLATIRNLRAGGLSGGQQQMVAVARGLMARPQILLLDEPSLGISPKLTGELADTLAMLRQDHGLTIVLVEQNVRMGLSIADRVVVLKGGRAAHEGTPADFADAEKLARIFLS